MKRETITRLLAEEEAQLAGMEEPGDNSEEHRQSDIRDWADRHAMRPSADNLKAVRASIGEALRALHSGVLREEVPDRIAELLRVDHQKDTEDVSGRRRSSNLAM
jgi:hypothetical protein